MPGLDVAAPEEGFRAVEEEAVGDGPVRVAMIGFGPGSPAMVASGGGSFAPVVTAAGRAMVCVVGNTGEGLRDRALDARAGEMHRQFEDRRSDTRLPSDVPAT